MESVRCKRSAQTGQTKSAGRRSSCSSIDVPRQFTRLAEACVFAALSTIGCGRGASEVQRHAEKIDSLRASAVSVTTAWLAGDVSGTYTITALERTFELVANERDAVAS